MSLGQRRILWFLVWLVVLLSGPVSVIRNTNFQIVFSDSVLTINFFQRLLGLVSFSLLFSQIMLGAFMGKWLSVLGAKAFRWHTSEGLATYLIILLHPFAQVLLDYKRGGLLVSLLALLPGGDLNLNLGKVALLLLTLGTVAGYFRTRPFFRRHWRKFHAVNYIAFLFVAIHSRNLGTDIKTPPFVWVYWVGVIAVSLTIIHKWLYPRLMQRYKTVDILC